MSHRTVDRTHGWGAWLLALLFLAACGESESGPESGPLAPEDATSDDGTHDDPSDGDTDSPPSDALPDDGSPEEETCLSDERFFEDHVWSEVIEVQCTVCHREGGLAGTSGFRMVSAVRPDYLQVNRERLEGLARTERDGVSVLLRKPLGELEHGGGVVIARDSRAYDVLEEFVERTRSPSDCTEPPAERSWRGIVMDDPARTLRQATLQLAGRLPSREALVAVADQGEDGLRNALRALMQEDFFPERMGELFDDVLWTERYARHDRANNIMDAELFPNRRWYQEVEDEDLRRTLATRTNIAIARQPRALVEHVVRERLPLHTILTADFVMVNAYSARSFGLESGIPDVDNPALEAMRAVQIQAHPSAGVLTTPAFLHRYPSTPTNRNRHRSRIFYDRFLATDILALADRPIDPTTSQYHNPTLNDATCTNCHALLDPVAGAFQHWDDRGQRRVREAWHGDMLPPGIEDRTVPATYRERSLQWLAQEAADDPRFGLAMIQAVFTGLVGRAPLRIVDGANPDADPVRREMYRMQRDFFLEVLEAFQASNQDIRVIVEAILMSPWYRAVAATDDASSAAVAGLGRARIHTPEDFNRRIVALTGISWRPSWSREDFLLDRYRLLMGGLDFENIVDRLQDPNALMVGVIDRFAVHQACRATPIDFGKARGERLLFPHVETTYRPFTPEGFQIPEAIEAIRKNLQHLHTHLLGEPLALDDPEIDASYALFLTLWQEGMEARAEARLGRDLPWNCQLRDDPVTGQPLEDHRRIQRDDDALIRAWIGVVASMLSDYRFLHE